MIPAAGRRSSRTEMSKKHLLFLFCAAGLILAVVIGSFVYQLYREPSRAEIESLISDYVGKIAAGDLNGARELMTEDSKAMLRTPGTILGEVIYRNLSLKIVDNVYSEGDGAYAAEVVLSVPDALKITAKAGLLYAEQTSENGVPDDPDRKMAEIYEEILARSDLPIQDYFCVMHLEVQNGKLLIKADETLQTALEGGTRLRIDD